MGLLRDLALAVGRAALDTLTKAGEDDQDGRKAKPQPDEEDGAAPQEGDGEASAGPQDGPDAAEPPEVDGEPVDPQEGEQPPSQAMQQAQPADAQQQANPPLMPNGPRTPRTPQELEAALSDPKSLFWDPFAVIDALGYKDKPSSITYQTLRAMVWRMPIVQAMIRTRLRQMSNFSAPQVDKYSTGFRITMKDKKAQPSPETEARSRQLEEWLLTTGVTENPGSRDNFDTFLQKFVQDSLTYDQACFEVVPSRTGKPAAFYAVDASTIRIADTTRLFLNPEDKDVVRFVQIYDGLVVSEYTSSELCFGIRNPTADIRNQQYGQSELEMLVTVVTALLWSFDYNQKFFSQGANVKGIINFKGPIPEKHLRAFRQHWYSMTAGVENAFRTPIVNADDMQYVSMQQSNRDMEFNAWFDFLIKITAAIYGMDPMEINFKYGDSGGAKSMFESANQSKLSASKDKGLKPLLRFVQDKINQHLIQPLDPAYVFEFVGLEADSKSEQADLTTKLIKSIKTVNEARAEEDMPPLPDGDIILDPVYSQHMSQRVQQEQQEKMQAQGLGPDGQPMGQPPGDEDGPPQGLPQDDVGNVEPPGPDEQQPGDDQQEKSLRRRTTTLRKGIPAVRKRVVFDVEV